MILSYFTRSIKVNVLLSLETLFASWLLRCLQRIGNPNQIIPPTLFAPHFRKRQFKSLISFDAQDSLIFILLLLLQKKKVGVASHLDGGPRCAAEIGSTSRDVGKERERGEMVKKRNSEVGRTPTPPGLPPFNAQRRSSCCILPLSRMLFYRLASTGSVGVYIESKKKKSIERGATPIPDPRHSKYENLCPALYQTEEEVDVLLLFQIFFSIPFHIFTCIVHRTKVRSGRKRDVYQS